MSKIHFRFNLKEIKQWWRNRVEEKIRKRKPLLIIEISDSVLKAVIIGRSKEKKRIAGVYVRNLKEETFSESIKDILKKVKLEPRVFLAIPRSQIGVKFLTLPFTEHSEIEAMIYQSNPSLYSPEEIVVGYRIIEVIKEEHIKLMVVMVHKEVIHKNLEMLKEVNIIPECVALSIEGILLLLSNNKNIKRIFKTPVCVINIDHSSTEMEVILGNNILFSRNIPLGFSSKEIYGDDLLNEISQFLLSFQKEGEKEISRIVLLGSRENLQKLKKGLKRRLLSSVHILQPLRGLPKTSNLTTLLKSRIYHQYSFLGLCGIGLYAEKLEINLLPPEFRIEKETILLKKKFAFTLFLSFFLLSAGTGIFLEKLHYQDLYLFALKSKLHTLVPSTTKLENKLKKIRVVKEYFGEHISSLEVLGEVYHLIPEEISLTLLNYNSRKKILILKGLSQDMGNVPKFADILESSRLFKDVSIKYTSRKRMSEKELAEFEIHCSLAQ